MDVPFQPGEGIINNLTANFAAILATILVVHNVVDHLIQTDAESACKVAPGRKGWRAALSHGCAHGAWVLGALLALYLLDIIGRPSLTGLITGAVFISLTHAFIDRRWPIVWWLEHTGSAAFAQLTTPINGKYVADQAAHWACAFVGALLIVKL